MRFELTAALAGTLILTTPVPDAARLTAQGTAATKADASELAARLSTSVDRFEREVAALVIEERYVQIAEPWHVPADEPDDEALLAWDAAAVPQARRATVVARRQLLSDVLLVRAEDGRWIGFRDVAEVDGRPVRDRADRVRDLFLSRAADRGAQLNRIALESARYNLGNARRTINIPTLALTLLRGGNHRRFALTASGQQDVDGVRCDVLAFKESARPTLIATS